MRGVAGAGPSRDSGGAAHHAVGVGVTGLRDGQTLDDLGGHPGEGPHHRHVGGVREELGRAKVTNLEEDENSVIPFSFLFFFFYTWEAKHKPSGLCRPS